MADGMAVMRSGRVEQIGAPRDLYDRPASRFVAEFMGETNFIEARILDRGAEHVVLDSAVGRLLASAPHVSDIPTTGGVICSIRPEAWRVANGDNERNSLMGKILESVYLGGMAQHLIELAPGVQVKVAELNPPREGRADSLRVAVDPSDVVVLPA